MIAQGTSTTISAVFLGVGAVFYVGAFVYALWRLICRRDTPQIVFYIFLAGGFLSQSMGLYLRGMATGTLPMATPFELLQAIAWCAVFIDLVLRFFYHVRLLRLFASGLAALLCVGSWAIYHAPQAAAPLGSAGDPWIGLHVGLAVFGYAVFALSALSGAMYLIQKRALADKHGGDVFRLLPSLRVLDHFSGWLLPIGLCTLALSILLGFACWFSLPAGEGITLLKLALTSLVWIGFFAVFLLRKSARMSAAGAGYACVILFVLALISLWAVNRDREMHLPRSEDARQS